MNDTGGKETSTCLHFAALSHSHSLPRLRASAWLSSVLTAAVTHALLSSRFTSVTCVLRRSTVLGSTPSMLNFWTVPCVRTCLIAGVLRPSTATVRMLLYTRQPLCIFLLERMTSLPVLVLGIGVVKSQSMGIGCSAWYRSNPSDYTSDVIQQQ